jgi:hypothetical protein
MRAEQRRGTVRLERTGHELGSHHLRLLSNSDPVQSMADHMFFRVLGSVATLLAAVLRVHRRRDGSRRTEPARFDRICHILSWQRLLGTRRRKWCRKRWRYRASSQLHSTLRAAPRNLQLHHWANCGWSASRRMGHRALRKLTRDCAVLKQRVLCVKR